MPRLSHLLLLPVVAVGACTLPTDVPFPSDAVQIEAPPAYALWWKVTESCSGLGGDFSAVRWYVVPNTSVIHTGNDQAIGYWFADGNRIVLAGNYEMNAPVVRHEMLHALVGPAQEGGHPHEYFVHRCGGIVHCEGSCINDGGPSPTPVMDAPVIPATQLQTGVDVMPSHVSQSVYGGWFAITVSVTNPRTTPVWVDVPRVGPGRTDGPTFAWALQGEIAAYDYTYADRVYFEPGETKRYAFDTQAGGWPVSATPATYSIQGLFVGISSDPTSLVVGN